MANENILIENVEFNWARLATPAKNKFGGENYELQIVASKDRADELSKVGTVKETEDGRISVNLKRKATKRDGSAMDPVRVVDGQRNPIEAKGSIGNGSKGSVIVYAYDYEFGGQSGRAFSLTAVQVTDLVEYTGGTNTVDFGVVEASGETNPF